MLHLLAADLAATDSPCLRWMGCSACRCLLARMSALSDFPWLGGVTAGLPRRGQWELACRR
jgi:hypothetical protein